MLRVPTKINASISVKNRPQYAALAREIEAFILVGTLKAFAGFTGSSEVKFACDDAECGLLCLVLR